MKNGTLHNTWGRFVKGFRELERSAFRTPFSDRVDQMVLLVAILGPLAVMALWQEFGTQPWPLLPWLILTAVATVLALFPYRIIRPGHSYYMDFGELVLVVSLLFLGPVAIVAVFAVGYLIGAIIRRTDLRRVVFNLGTRMTAVSAALALLPLIPLPSAPTWNYVVAAFCAALVYSFITQLLVCCIVALISGRRSQDEFWHALTTEMPRAWPMIVCYGIVIGLVSFVEMGTLFIAAVPVALMLTANHRTQLRRDEHVRMKGLYSAAQRMHEANSDRDVLEALDEAVRITLGARGSELRSAPPSGEELGVWLPNRRLWLVVPYTSSPGTRRQDDAFLQALSSLVDSGMERVLAVGELERQSMRDPLTNAFNRRYFMQALGEALATGNSGCLALIDIDHFKVINDTYGHQVGDLALKDLVAAVEGTFRNDDILCRLGGDEFALILPGLDTELAANRLEQLRVTLERAGSGNSHAEPGSITFRASIGLAPFIPGSRDADALFSRADQALYEAKRGGRNRVVVFRQVQGEPAD